jgi:hypothetical protein
MKAARPDGRSRFVISVCNAGALGFVLRLVPVEGDGLSAAGCHHLREGELSHHSQGVNATHFIVE